MATLGQYFETDFSNTLRVHGTFKHEDEDIRGLLLYDLMQYSAFLLCYIHGTERTYDYFVSFLRMLDYGRTPMYLTDKITLPPANPYRFELQFDTKPDFEIRYRVFGDPAWRSTREISLTRRIFIYSETELSGSDTTKLLSEGESLGHKLIFLSREYVQMRTSLEAPLAFICHDYRDKEDIARPIAVNLQNMRCPVWYDEFSLKVGANLRESIEKGLKECKKCVLVLSSHFLSNNGWTKREFDSIFTREILEQKRLVLPIWHGITRHDVYEYSPSLLNIKALNWDEIGEKEVCRQLCRAIIGLDEYKDWP